MHFVGDGMGTEGGGGTASVDGKREEGKCLAVRIRVLGSPARRPAVQLLGRSLACTASMSAPLWLQ
jgi:hypothetical protein